MGFDDGENNRNQNFFNVFDVRSFFRRSEGCDEGLGEIFEVKSRWNFTSRLCTGSRLPALKPALCYRNSLLLYAAGLSGKAAGPSVDFLAFLGHRPISPVSPFDLNSISKVTYIISLPFIL